MHEGCQQDLSHVVTLAILWLYRVIIRPLKKDLHFTAEVSIYLFIYLFCKISKLPRPIAMKLCHVTRILVYFIMQVTKFGQPYPTI